MLEGTWSAAHKMPPLIEGPKIPSTGRMALGQLPGPPFVEGAHVLAHICTHRHRCGHLLQGPLSSPEAALPPCFCGKASLQARGFLPPFHGLFICLIKVDLIKAGIAETRKHSSERRSWPNPKRGLCVPTPGQWPAGSRAPGEWAEEPRSRREGALLGQAGLTSSIHHLQTHQKNVKKKRLKNEKTLEIRRKAFWK